LRKKRENRLTKEIRNIERERTLKTKEKSKRRSSKRGGESGTPPPIGELTSGL